jgi:hypothetical protein
MASFCRDRPQNQQSLKTKPLMPRNEIALTMLDGGEAIAICIAKVRAIASAIFPKLRLTTAEILTVERL